MVRILRRLDHTTPPPGGEPPHPLTTTPPETRPMPTATAAPIKIRFHLGAGPHFMTWRVQTPHGVEFFEPSGIS